MVAIERDNPRLKGVLPKDYARPGLNKHRLGERIDLIGTITLACSGALRPSGDANDEDTATVTDRRYSSRRSVDLLGHVDEYFFTRFTRVQFAESAKLELAINANLENLMLKLKS